MRVYVPTTPARVAALREHGLPEGTEAYAATPALAEALGMPAPGSEDADDDLAEVAVATAAEASLLLLAEDAAAGSGGGAEDHTGEQGSPGDAGSTGTGVAPPGPRRVVLAAEAPARPLGGDAHPATVVLTAPLPFAAVDTVLADDGTVPDRLARAVAAVDEDQERGVRMLENTALGWFAPSELD
ncbi:DUF6912 family protein [Aquipuribacter hungaricus]|uniref:DUF6912 family protein n=1 Tax=Aquipuribacter hungaricus TaxID=545624 RepID=A0ABV7WFV1_9MICO